MPMNVTRSFRVLVLLVMLGTLHPAAARAEKSYRVEGVAIEAKANADGSLDVAENRTYRFNGSFKFAYRTFSTRGGIAYADFQVSEGDRSYVRDDSQAPGTYRVTDTDDGLEVRWYYEARNQTRSFTIAYRVENVVQRHLDAAVLYHQFLGSDFAKSSANVELTVAPPVDLNPSQIQQWLHGPLWAESEIRPNGVITAWCERLPAHQFLELRVLYPADIFPGARTVDDLVLYQVREEEAAWAEKANRLRTRAIEKAAARAEGLALGGNVVPLVCLAALGVWVGIFWRYGRRSPAPDYPAKSPHIPSDLPPALVSFLVAGRTVNGNSMMATLMDLASRGFLEFHVHIEEKEVFLGLGRKKNRHYWILNRERYQEQRAMLLPYEEMLIDFLFDKLAKGDRAEMDLFKKDQSKSLAFFKKWKNAVTDEGKGHRWYSPQGFTGRNYGMMLGGLLIILSVPLFSFYYEWAILAAALGVLLIPLSLTMVHHSPAGAAEAAGWKSLHGYLKYERSRTGDFRDSVERYLVYGVALGLGTKALTELANVLSGEGSAGFIPWFYGQGGHQGFSGESFGSAFSSSVAAMNSSMSSATGSGGGASGGGGGGSGGGGGGAG